MTLENELDSMNRLAIDTAPIIYFAERNPIYLECIRTVFAKVDTGNILGISSVITLTELLVHPMRLGNRGLTVKYRQLLQESRNFHLVAVDEATA